ncbi:acyltransferase [Pseudomonas sp. Xaverov 83]|uniref:acyltransferase family protein n=1 Tax=Pseudomonas sp. Xaverov 83 TaxID=2666087 RepID=UPI001C5BD870|nr:acyltransferase [Pseudomonas sp. Xaverov 83]
MTDNQLQKLNNIQFLRFIAAVLVVIAHGSVAPFGLPNEFFNTGRFGVDIFFVISGFIIPYILFGGSHTEMSKVKLSGWAFFLRRVARIWPMYFLVTMLVFVCVWIVGSGWFKPNPDLAFAFSVAKLDMKLLFESLTFTHSFIAPTLDVGWTLQFEFMFYTIIAILMVVGVRRLETFIISTAAVMLISLFILNSTAKPYLDWIAPVKLIGSSMMFEFLFGLVLYRVHSAGVHLAKIPAILILVFAIPLLLVVQLNNLLPGLNGQAFYRPIVWGALAFMMVWAALSLEGIYEPHRYLVLLGNASYSLYLIHWILMPWVAHFFDTYGLYKYGVVFFYFVYLGVCLGASVVLFKYVENPMNTAIKKHLL